MFLWHWTHKSLPTRKQKLKKMTNDKGKGAFKAVFGRKMTHFRSC